MAGWKKRSAEPARTLNDKGIGAIAPNGGRHHGRLRRESREGLPAEFVAAEIPAARYAMFPHEGHVSQMRYTFNAIFTEWLPKSGLEPDRDAKGIPFCLERYGPGFDPQKGEGNIEIWVPVRKRG